MATVSTVTTMGYGSGATIQTVVLIGYDFPASVPVTSSKRLFKSRLFNNRMFAPAMFRGVSASEAVSPSVPGLEFTCTVPMMHFAIGISALNFALKEEQP